MARLACSLGVALRANNSYTRALESFTLALSLNHTLVRSVLPAAPPPYEGLQTHSRSLICAWQDEALLNIGSTWMDLGNFERAAGAYRCQLVRTAVV